ncbi:MAG: AMP-dependent synthetase/ligase [Actinobacteria bacterium]|nr:AMP-dependent synthetase/ligase [Actinomycetota bacterium]
MKQYTSPGDIRLDPTETLTAPVWRNAETAPKRAALAFRDGDRFVDVTSEQFAGTVRALAKGFIGLGIKPGSKIAILSPTRIEWTYLDYAIWAAGCVTVPIYETSSAEQIEWIISNSEAVSIVMADEQLEETFNEVAGKLKKCKHRFVIDKGGLDAIQAAGESVEDDEVTKRVDATSLDDVATLVYTSGTTGMPKGCVLTHNNLMFDAISVESSIDELMEPGDSTLLFLPLAHIFARVIQTFFIRSGLKIAYSTGIPKLTEELVMVQPTLLLSVPRVFEKVFTGAQQKAHSEGKGKIFDKAAALAERYSREEQAGGAKLTTKLQHALFDKLVYVKLRNAVGGKVKGAISGGAALGERLGHFFHGAGLPIYEGYGLTETSAGATLNRPDAYRIGSVGRPIPGTSVGIADDGEVLLKGGNVFAGYYKNDEATQEAVEDGWFHTGDLGELDADGYLRITGRKKEIIVTAAGKNVAPNVLEDRLRSHRLVSQAMVVGDGEKFIGCLVAIDPEQFPAWADEHGKTGKSVADLVDDPELRADVQQAVDSANRAVSRAEAIKEFRIVPDDFTIEGGELTPTLKVKRRVVHDKYGNIIDDIYGRS